MTLLRTITLAGHPLRIYASPLPVPDHPWASFDDLAALAEFDRDEWATKLRADVPDMLHTAPDGTLLLAEPMVGGMFQAWVWMGYEAAQELLDDWTAAWSELFAASCAHLSRDEWLAVVREAGLRNVPHVPGVTVVQ